METTEEQNIQNALVKQKLIYASTLKKVKEEIVERFNTDANVVMNWELILNEILDKHFGNIGDTHYIYDCNKEKGLHQEGTRCKCGHSKEEHEEGLYYCWEEGCDCQKFNSQQECKFTERATPSADGSSKEKGLCKNCKKIKSLHSLQFGEYWCNKRSDKKDGLKKFEEVGKK